ncbi:MAG: tRNA-dependent cyclodipeptide synthase [Methylococcaceae bacterium]|nr:tRNA-dependent cyclodipeptide synthase [Methylococcaceae bacterium]
MVFTSVTKLLDERNLKYIAIANSAAYDPEEVKKIALDGLNDSIGRELIEAVPIRVNDSLAIAIAPATEKISLVSLQEQLGTGKVNFLGKAEIHELFPQYEQGTIPPLGELHHLPAYCSVSIYDNNREITFYAGSYKYRIRMTFENYKAVANLDESIRFTTSARYRASVLTRVPFDVKDRMKTIDNCILGVSLGNSSFFPSKLVASTDWVNNNFKNCKVMIGDSLYRITLQITHGYKDETKARQKALFLGQKFINDQRVLFERHAKTCDFEFVLASEIQRQDDYKVYHQQIVELFETNDSFNNSVMSFAHTFVGRNIDESDETREKKYMLSASYLLEELAVFSCLIQDGFPIFVYPGSIDVVIEIADGKHPGVPKTLQELMYISLFLKRRK